MTRWTFFLFLITFLLLGLCRQINAQDTIYYNENRKPTTSKDSIRYQSIQYTWKTIQFSDLDTSTIEILNQNIKYGNGQTNQTGTFRHLKVKYGQVKEYYLPIGKHVSYFKNGKTKRIQNYTQSGFLLTDTVCRKSGKIKLTMIYKIEQSRIQSNYRELYFNDRYFYITFYYRNGNKDCEGLGESERNIWLNRRDTWKFYKKKEGTFKYELKYKSST